MSTEQPGLSAYEAALRDLEAERDEINFLIEGMRRRIDGIKGRPAQSQPGQRTPSNETEIPSDAFFQMTIADAARKYLEIVKHTKSASLTSIVF